MQLWFLIAHNSFRDLISCLVPYPQLLIHISVVSKQTQSHRVICPVIYNLTDDCFFLVNNIRQSLCVQKAAMPWAARTVILAEMQIRKSSSTILYPFTKLQRLLHFHENVRMWTVHKNMQTVPNPEASILSELKRLSQNVPMNKFLPVKKNFSNNTRNHLLSTYCVA